MTQEKEVMRAFAEACVAAGEVKEYVASLKAKIAVLELAQEQHNAVLQAKELEYEKALARVRDGAFEKAANLVKVWSDSYFRMGNDYIGPMLSNIVKEIRALKSKENPMKESDATFRAGYRLGIKEAAALVRQTVKDIGSTKDEIANAIEELKNEVR